MGVIIINGEEVRRVFFACKKRKAAVKNMNKEAKMNLEIGEKFARKEEAKVFFILCRLADKEDYSLPPNEEMMPLCGYGNPDNFAKVLRHLQRRTLLIEENDTLKINREWVTFV